MESFRDEEELTMKMTIRTFEIDLLLADANGEILATWHSTFAKPINVEGVTRFVRKEAVRLSDMISEAIFISYGHR